MATTVPLATFIDVLSSIFMWRKSLRRSSDIELDAARSCESAVDMVAARIPAMMIPATIAKNTPFLPIRFARQIMIVSDSDPVVRNGISPATDTL